MKRYLVVEFSVPGIGCATIKGFDEYADALIFYDAMKDESNFMPPIIFRDGKEMEMQGDEDELEE